MILEEAALEAAQRVLNATGSLRQAIHAYHQAMWRDKSAAAFAAGSHVLYSDGYQSWPGTWPPLDQQPYAFHVRPLPPPPFDVKPARNRGNSSGVRPGPALLVISGGRDR